MFKYFEKTKVKACFCPECMSDKVSIDHIWQKLDIEVGGGVKKPGWREVSFLLPKIKLTR